MTFEEVLCSAKPILFNTEMVEAILENRKTTTRRAIKFPMNLFSGKYPNPNNISLYSNTAKSRAPVFHEHHYCYDAMPPYHIGDYLYVRETWSEWTGGYLYKAKAYGLAQPGESSIMKWYPSIHMPKKAARIFLRVTNIHAERIQHIIEAQARAEGFVNDINLIDGTGKSATKHFSEFWDTTIKKTEHDRYSWEANPWVWIIMFERIFPEMDDN